MTESNQMETTTTSSLKEWIEPEMRELQLTETMANPHGGGDGGTFRADCTLS